MHKTADIAFQDNRYMIGGDLSFDNVMSVYQKSLEQSGNSSELIFDFSRLHSTDSAGLALIVEWIKLSKQLSKPIHFYHLSEDIMSLAKAAGVDGMFNGKE